ncbi:MAG: transglutaminase-like domain-containing protein [Moraxellaceae bacterium]
MNTNTNMNTPEYLQATPYLDHDQDAVRAYVDKVCAGAGSDRERAIALYYAVRDDIRYDPFSCTLDADGLRASHVLSQGRSYCVGKAVLLAAVGRAAGIPTRLGFADVRNHFTSPQLTQLMGTDIFYYHGYADFYLGGRWVKLTPAFNRELCEKMKSPALEFDGENDAIFQEMENSQGRLRMEYLRYHAPMNDLDPELIFGEYAKRYPAMMKAMGAMSK